MRFAEEYDGFVNELDSYYATYPTDVSPLNEEIERMSEHCPEWGPCRRKAIIYEVAAKACRAKVFRHVPFFFELDTGLSRYRWGSLRSDHAGIGAWMTRQPRQRDLERRAEERLTPARELGLSLGPSVLDFDHHCVGYDNVLGKGLEGIIAEARNRLEGPVGEAERDFLSATIVGNQSLIAVAGRFAAEADRLAALETDPTIARRLRTMAAAARRVPANPAGSFYEALCVIRFMRHVLGGLEGIGESILGHLDRMLGPYLERDLAAGRITAEAAFDLLQCFLAITDAKCNIKEEPRETSTTVVIGGCDRAGSPVFNDVTRMVIEAYRSLRLVNPKLNARLSPSHPKEYFRLLSDLTSAGTNVLAVYNDAVLIEANERMGKAVEDCRLYVGGGCQENVLQNTEINSRASIYLNIADVLLVGFFPERFLAYTDTAAPDASPLSIETYAGVQSYEELYRRFLVNLGTITNQHIDQRNATEGEGWWYNPCPAHSSTMDDCIERGRDMMDGGTRYAGASVSLIGAGTVIDSLRVVRDVVFDSPRLDLEELASVLENDFRGHEALRQYALNRVAKYGDDDPEMGDFAAGILADLARVTSGRQNTRGGAYEASLFVYRTFVGMGAKTGATPDGRRAGEPLSPGMGPGPVGVHRSGGVTALLNALRPLDLTDYPVAAVLDVKLPWSKDGLSTEVLESLYRRFLDVGGSVLQFNVVDPATLEEAREHPEAHADLVVRVSGYSARFTTLPDKIQDEIIRRETLRV